MTFQLSPAIMDLTARFGLDVAAVIVLIYGMYYRRYRDKELATTAAMFNVFAFSVLTILSSVNFSIAAGFGLFAILALFSLRSEPFNKIEITYFFGSIGLAVICSIQGTEFYFVLLVTVVTLISAFLFDHPRLLRSVAGVKITLDKIDPHALSDPERMRADLSKRLGVDVMSYQMTALNYVNDLAQLSVFYRKS